MKRIINGKRYDTETATEVASYGYGGGSDFSHVRESLYRTKNGNWFLAGEGGPRTRYAYLVNQTTWSGGCELFPLTEAEVLEWLEQHKLVKVIEKYFSDKIVDA